MADVLVVDAARPDAKRGARPILRKVLKVAACVLAFFAVVVTGLVVNARRVVTRDYSDVPAPPIVADTSTEAIARGELLFHSLCMECHKGADGRATGQRLHDIPAFLGTVHSANLAHPETGVHKRTDAQLARVIRTGVLPDGRLSLPMSLFGQIGDADVAAILGYMRSGAPPFEPGGDAQPASQISLAGTVIAAYVAKLDPKSAAATIPVPKKAPTPEYGRYMAKVLDCVGCHTEGFSSSKMEHPAAFAGGGEFVDPTGTKIFSRNITMDEETGIGRWSLDDFAQAITRGARPDGTLVRKPMPLFSRLDRVDVEAIHKFLSTMPKVKRENQPGGHPLEKAQTHDAPDAMFTKLGCASCHGETGPYRDAIRGALGKTDAEVAAWILDPQATKPGSAMPSFRTMIDQTQALALAKYVKELAVTRK